MKKLLIFGITILIMSSAISVTYGSGYFLYISSRGTINVPPTDSFLSGFEDVYEKDGEHLGGEMWDSVDHIVQVYSGLDGEWGISRDESHSGRWSLKFKINDPASAERAQVNLKIWQHMGPEVSVSMWYKFPADWDASWYVLAELCRERDPGGSITDGQELVIEIIIETHPTYGTKWFALRARDLATIDPETGKKLIFYKQWLCSVIRGEWFHVQWYLKRHPTNGIVRVWINGDLKAERLNDMTWLSQDYYYINVMRIYSDLNDNYPKTVYGDDLIIQRPGG